MSGVAICHCHASACLTLASSLSFGGVYHFAGPIGLVDV